MQPSDVSGEGFDEGINVSPVQVRAYSDAEQASWHASATTCPSGPRIVPSCALNAPPLGTLQMLCVGVAQQPTLLASPLEVTLAGQLHAPASTMLKFPALASSSPTCASCWHSGVPVMLRHRLGAQHSSLPVQAWNDGKQAAAVSALACCDAPDAASASAGKLDPQPIRASTTAAVTAARIELSKELVIR